MEKNSRVEIGKTPDPRNGKLCRRIEGNTPVYEDKDFQEETDLKKQASGLISGSCKKGER
jgi:hypothetical protein